MPDRGHLLTLMEAAELLGVTPRRVRHLVTDNALQAARAGRQLLLDRDDVEAFERTRHRFPSQGRPWSARLAWAALFLLDGDEQPLRELSPQERYRVRARLRDMPGFSELAPKLSRRAEVERFSGHPSVLADVREAGMLTGAAAIGSHDVGLPSDPRAADVYVSDQVERELRTRLALRAGGRNVVLRVIAADAWPSSASSVAPSGAVALDLLESPDARDHAAAERLIKRLDGEWSQ